MEDHITRQDISPLAGKPAAVDQLVDVPKLVAAYYDNKPDVTRPTQNVIFGTSGHRGSSLNTTYNEHHILAITQAICDFRKHDVTNGPVFMGRDTHALSEPAFTTAIEVLGANGIEVMVDSSLGYTPTPAVSLAILRYNREHPFSLADGIVITPSHNPPQDGGLKYNTCNGGPANTSVTKWIENRSNELLQNGLREVRRLAYKSVLNSVNTHLYDFLSEYVTDLSSIIDFKSVRAANLKLAVDPMGGASVAYWPRIAERYNLTIDVVNTSVDPTFSFMHMDWDGNIRMDCSSPYAMASLTGLCARYPLAVANDTDADRHAIVTGSGLLPPNHYLAVAISYLFNNRPDWNPTAAIGKTLVTSSIIDYVANGLGRKLLEVPVGFKWFVEGLLNGSIGFGGEESAGASFLRHNGTVWTTDKDGLIMGLLAAEMLARTGKDPGQLYADLTARYGNPLYKRVDAALDPTQKSSLARLTPGSVKAKHLAGERIESILCTAPGNGAPIDGLKIVAKSGWFAARTSGAESIYRIYAETFAGEQHLNRIIEEAQSIITCCLYETKYL